MPKKLFLKARLEERAGMVSRPQSGRASDESQRANTLGERAVVLRKSFLADRITGFTLIELLITVAILAAIAAIGGINLFSYYSRQNLGLSAEEITAMIRDAQNRTLVQQDGNADDQGDQWGIHFENKISAPDLAQLFCCGSSYALGTVVGTYNLRTGVELTDPSEGNSKDIIFSRLTGYPGAATSITIALKNSPSVSSIITVSAIGQVLQ